MSYKTCPNCGSRMYKRERRLYVVEDSYGYQHFIGGTHEECIEWKRNHPEVKGTITYYGT